MGVRTSDGVLLQPLPTTGGALGPCSLILAITFSWACGLQTWALKDSCKISAQKAFRRHWLLTLCRSCADHLWPGGFPLMSHACCRPSLSVHSQAVDCWWTDPACTLEGCFLCAQGLQSSSSLGKPANFLAMWVEFSSPRRSEPQGWDSFPACLSLSTLP